MSFDQSSDFVVGVPTEETMSFLTEVTSPQMIHLNCSPIVYLSPPRDRADTVQLPTTEVVFTVQGHVFSYNPSTGRNEFCLIMDIHEDFRTLFSDLDLDLQHFVPYARLGLDPMRTKASRFWCNSVGNNLQGKTLTFTVTTSEAPILKAEFNTEVFNQYTNGHRW